MDAARDSTYGAQLEAPDPWDGSGDLTAGTVIDERYVVEGCLGHGGVATVYRCRHIALGTEHAVKVVRTFSPAVARRLASEGRAQAMLQHPNVVRVTDAMQVDGAPALVMELVQGPSLDELISAAALTQGQIDDLAAGLLAGVAAAHAFGVVHRDLKPSNVLVDLSRARPVLKIADFGLVKLLAGDDSATHRTRQGVAMGTPEYMAPEQIRSARDVDARADVFSLGAILYELVTGVRCFQSNDVLVLFNRIDRGIYRPVVEIAPHAPRRVVRAINAALEPDLDRRCPSVEALTALWFDGSPELGDPWEAGGWRLAATRAADRPPVPVTRSTFPPMDAVPRSAPSVARTPPRPAAPVTSPPVAPLGADAQRWQLAGLGASLLTVAAGVAAVLLILQWRGEPVQALDEERRAPVVEQGAVKPPAPVARPAIQKQAPKREAPPAPAVEEKERERRSPLRRRERLLRGEYAAQASREVQGRRAE